MTTENQPQVQATWERTFSAAEPAHLDVSIPGKGSLEGTVFSTDNGLQLSISGFNVEQQGRGTGTQLAMAAAALAQECGIATITAEVESPAVMKILDKIAPGQAVIKSAEPMTPAQARDYLNEGKVLQEKGENVHRTVEFETSLPGEKTRGWQMPAIQNKAPLELRRALYRMGVKPPRSERQIRQAEARQERIQARESGTSIAKSQPTPEIARAPHQQAQGKSPEQTIERAQDPGDDFAQNMNMMAGLIGAADAKQKAAREQETRDQVQELTKNLDQLAPSHKSERGITPQVPMIELTINGRQERTPYNSPLHKKVVALNLEKAGLTPEQIQNYLVGAMGNAQPPGEVGRVAPLPKGGIVPKVESPARTADGREVPGVLYDSQQYRDAVYAHMESQGIDMDSPAARARMLGLIGQATPPREVLDSAQRAADSIAETKRQQALAREQLNRGISRND